MQVTVTIPDELAAEVQARGLTPESYVEKLVADRAYSAPVQSRTEDKLASLERFFEEMAMHSDKIPLLPDEAFTRESCYRDCD
jgi:hypothetical protein